MSPITTALANVSNLTPSLALPEIPTGDAALHIAKTLQSAIFSSPTISSIAFDAMGEIQEFNVRAQRLLGYSTADVTKPLKLADICDPLDLVMRAVGQSSEFDITNAPGHEGVFELNCIRRDGQRLPVMASVVALHNAECTEAIGYLLAFVDNTAHKRLQALQIASASSMQKIASRLPGMVYQYRLHPDGSSCFPYASDAIHDVCRVSPQDVREDASCLLSLIHPDDYNGVIATIQKSALDLTPWEHEYRLRFADGEERWQLGNALPEREVDGATLWHGFITDITERKATEKALRLSESRMQATLAAIPDLMFELDLEGRYHDIHSPRTELLSTPGKAFLGQLVSDVLPVHAAQVVMTAIHEAHEQGYSSGQRFVLKLAPGELWFELSISRKTTEPGELPRFIVLSRDITERHQAKEQLRISDHALKTISQGVLINCPDGRILSANAAFMSITGYSEDEILGRTCSFVKGVQTDVGVIAAIRQAQLQATEFNGEILNYRKDGSSFWNEMSITPMFDATGKVSHFISITRDVTARKLAQEALEHHQTTLEKTVTTPTAELSTALEVSKISREDLLRSQLMLNQASHLAQVGAWSLDLGCEENFETITFNCSAEMYRLFDFRPEDIPVPSTGIFMAHVHQQDRQRLKDQVMKSLAEQCAWETEYRIVWADGSEHLVVQTGEFLFDALGNAKSMHGAVKDITAQRQLETQLRESKAQLHNTLKGVSSGNYEWNSATGVVNWSEEALSLFALPNIEMTPVLGTWQQAVHADDLERVEWVIKNAASQSQEYEVEWRVNLPAGVAPRWLLDRARPVMNKEGLLVLYRGIVIDITANKLAQAKIRSQQEQMQSILDNIPIGLSAFDSELNLIAKNQEFQTALELPDALFGDPITTFESIIRFNAERGEYGEGDTSLMVQTIIERARHPVVHQLERTRPNGVVLDVRGAPLPGGGFVTTYADISARKKAQYQIQYSAQLLEVSIAAIDQSFALYDEDDRLVFSNEKYASLFGSLTDQVLPGTRFIDLIRMGAELGVYVEARGRSEEWMVERMAAHTQCDTTFIQTTADGRVLKIIDRRLPDGQTVCFLIDVTEYAHATQAAESANVAKSQFLANMSHEIRTPMNGVLGLLTLLKETNLNDQQRDYTQKAEGAAHSLLGILNDILDFSKVEAGKMELDPEPFCMSDVARDMQTILAGNLNGKKVDLTFDLDPALPALVMGDAGRLKQVLINLGGNALKFTALGEVRIRVYVRHLESDNVVLAFEVIDSGIGLSPEQQLRVFAGFSQAEASTSRRFGGTGLGLAISQRLVVLMGGELKVTSSLGAGSTFYFDLKLPLVEQQQYVNNESTQSTPSTEVSASGLNLAGVRVLLVEDNLINQMVALELLGNQGALVQLAENGQLAIDALIATPAGFDVVLMDLQMPVMDGLQATRHIRQQLKLTRLPIIAMTANVMASDREDCLAAGMNDHIGKPFSIKDLVARLLHFTVPALSQTSLST